ncbi:MAG: energy-coupling factor ABC transporter permease [Gemmatimonadales bacterium]|nr:MAG: energy-coupling factor ABC transporter permease [Gemmatimonadales bacterium]
MHIMEGYLPVGHALAWSAAAAPFVAWGSARIARSLGSSPDARLLLGASGAFCFLLSSLKIPSVTGSTSHPTGVGMGTLLVGPGPMIVLGTIVLLFQALILAHGGITTLGANVMSMAVAGPFAAWGIYRLCTALRVGPSVAVFCAAAVASLVTYSVTTFQLAVAFPDPVHGLVGSLATFGALFAVTQIPLAVVEGLVTVVAVRTLSSVGLLGASALGKLSGSRGSGRPGPIVSPSTGEA